MRLWRGHWVRFTNLSIDTLRVIIHCHSVSLNGSGSNRNVQSFGVMPRCTVRWRLCRFNVVRRWWMYCPHWISPPLWWIRCDRFAQRLGIWSVLQSNFVLEPLSFRWNSEMVDSIMSWRHLWNSCSLWMIQNDLEWTLKRSRLTVDLEMDVVVDQQEMMEPKMKCFLIMTWLKIWTNRSQSASPNCCGFSLRRYLRCAMPIGPCKQRLMTAMNRFQPGNWSNIPNWPTVCRSGHVPLILLRRRCNVYFDGIKMPYKLWSKYVQCATKMENKLRSNQFGEGLVELMQCMDHCKRWANASMSSKWAQYLAFELD